MKHLYQFSLLLSLTGGLRAVPLQTAFMELINAGEPRLNAYSDGLASAYVADSLGGRFGVSSGGSVLTVPGSMQLNGTADLPGAPSNSSASAWNYGRTEGLLTFQCTGTCGATTMVALRFTVRGTAAVSGPFTDAVVWVYPSLDGMALEESELTPNGVDRGAFAGRTSLSFSGETFTLPAVEVPVGVPLHFLLEGGVGAWVNGQSAASAQLTNYLIEFAAMPFVLEPGITVSGADFNIVNNSFTATSPVPEPGSLFLCGAAAILLWRRRR